MGPLDLLTSRQALAQPMGLRSSDDARRRARSVHGPFESITIRREDRPNMTEMPIDAPPSTNTRAVRLTEIARIFLKIGAMSYGVGIMLGPQARKERIMRRLLRCGLALVLVMAALPTGDRTAHAADSILTEILRRGTVRIATAVATRPLRFEDENGN